MLAPNTYKLVIANAILFPLQVNLGFPISFFVICVFLVVLPVYVTPMLVAVDLLILLVGVAVYLLFIRWRRKPAAVEKMLRKFGLLSYSSFELDYDSVMFLQIC